MILLSFLSLLSLSLVLSQVILFTPSTGRVAKTVQQVTGRCSVNASIADSLEWYVRRDDNSSFVQLSNPPYILSDLSNGTSNTIFREFTVGFQYEIAGTYRCDALNGAMQVGTTTYLLVSEIAFIERNSDFEVHIGDGSFEVSCFFRSSPVTLNFSVEWCFKPYNFPHIDTSICIPLRNNSINSTVSPIDTRSPDTEYSFRYRVLGVGPGNAGNYSCNVSNGLNYRVGNVRVRVRDRMEILWPVIGIMIQMVVIAVCIIGHFIWDTYKERKNLKLRQEKENQNILSPNSPQVDPVTDDEHPPSEVLIKVVPN